MKTYTYKGDTYRVEKETETKHPEKRIWYASIDYVSLSTGKSYNREREEFYKLFKEV